MNVGFTAWDVYWKGHSFMLNWYKVITLSLVFASFIITTTNNTIVLSCLYLVSCNDYHSLVHNRGTAAVLLLFFLVLNSASWSCAYFLL